MIMKLELKHIAPYLPYGIKYGTIEKDWKTLEDYLNIRGELSTKGTIHNLNNHIDNPNIRLILRPLSDLTKEIEVNGEKFVPLEELKRTQFEYQCDFYDEYIEHVIDMPKWVVLQQAPYEILQLLIEWHFDLYELIPNGLAIDINTLES